MTTRRVDQSRTEIIQTDWASVFLIKRKSLEIHFLLIELVKESFEEFVLVVYLPLFCFCEEKNDRKQTLVDNNQKEPAKVLNNITFR